MTEAQQLTIPQWAERLANSGYRVFPLRPGDKRPAIRNWQRAASSDPATVAKWWPKDSDANIGVLAGERTIKGVKRHLVVVDLDTKNGVDGIGALQELAASNDGDLPETFEVSTPSGGRHVYFYTSRPVGTNASKIAPGVDVRAQGGFVVGIGSRLPAGEYTGDNVPIAECPTWLEVLLPHPGASTTGAATVTQLPGVDADRAVKRATAYLRDDAPEAIEGAGGDHTTFVVAAKLKDFGVPEADATNLMLEHWHDGCGWSQDDLTTKVHNAYRYGSNPQGADAPEAIFSAVPVTPDKKLRYVLQSVDELLSAPAPTWLIRGILPQKGMGVIYGRPGSGKTFLVLDIAMAVARGGEWAGARISQGDVLYIGLEGQIRTRIQAYKAHHAGDCSRFRALSGIGLNLLGPRDTKDLIESIKAAGCEPSLIVIDTLNRAIPGGDENSSTDMGKAIERAGQLTRAFDCLVLFVHHSGKDPGNGARGHSSLLGAADAELMVTTDATGNRRMKITKAKDAEDGREFSFGLTVVDLGPEPHEPGSRITSCVVTGLAAASHPQESRETKWTSDRQLVHRAFVAALAKATGREFDAASQCSTAQWRTAFYDQNPLGDDLDEQEAKSANAARKKKFDRGKDWLIAQRIVRQIGTRDLYEPAS